MTFTSAVTVRTSGFDDIFRDFPVKRVALSVQLPKSLEWIPDLEQRPLSNWF